MRSGSSSHRTNLGKTRLNPDVYGLDYSLFKRKLKSHQEVYDTPNMINKNSRPMNHDSHCVDTTFPIRVSQSKFVGNSQRESHYKQPSYDAPSTTDGTENPQVNYNWSRNGSDNTRSGFGVPTSYQPDMRFPDDWGFIDEIDRTADPPDILNKAADVEWARFLPDKGGKTPQWGATQITEPVNPEFDFCDDNYTNGRKRAQHRTVEKFSNSRAYYSSTQSYQTKTSKDNPYDTSCTNHASINDNSNHAANVKLHHDRRNQFSFNNANKRNFENFSENAPAPSPDHYPNRQGCNRNTDSYWKSKRQPNRSKPAENQPPGEYQQHEEDNYQLENDDFYEEPSIPHDSYWNVAASSVEEDAEGETPAKGENPSKNDCAVKNDAHSATSYENLNNQSSSPLNQPHSPHCKLNSPEISNEITLNIAKNAEDEIYSTSDETKRNIQEYKSELKNTHDRGQQPRGLSRETVLAKDGNKLYPALESKLISALIIADSPKEANSCLGKLSENIVSFKSANTEDEATRPTTTSAYEWNVDVEYSEISEFECGVSNISIFTARSNENNNSSFVDATSEDDLCLNESESMAEREITNLAEREISNLAESMKLGFEALESTFDLWESDWRSRILNLLVKMAELVVTCKGLKLLGDTPFEAARLLEDIFDGISAHKDFPLKLSEATASADYEIVFDEVCKLMLLWPDELANQTHEYFASDIAMLLGFEKWRPLVVKMINAVCYQPEIVRESVKDSYDGEPVEVVMTHADEYNDLDTESAAGYNYEHIGFDEIDSHSQEIEMNMGSDLVRLDEEPAAQAMSETANSSFVAFGCPVLYTNKSALFKPESVPRSPEDVPGGKCEEAVKPWGFMEDRIAKRDVIVAECLVESPSEHESLVLDNRAPLRPIEWSVSTMMPDLQKSRNESGWVREYLQNDPVLLHAFEQEWVSLLQSWLREFELDRRLTLTLEPFYIDEARALMQLKMAIKGHGTHKIVLGLLHSAKAVAAAEIHDMIVHARNRNMGFGARILSPNGDCLCWQLFLKAVTRL